MSSVGNAEKRSAQDEALRRARETYQEKETDQAKGHAAEMKRMAESYQAEIRDLQDTHNTQMNDLKDKAQDAVSNRDMRYQKEIEELRSMHQNQVRRQALEADTRMQKTRETAKASVEHTTAVKDQQKQVMAEQYESQIANDGKKFENYTNESRAKLQETVAGQREKLNQAHGKEVTALTAERDQVKNSGRKDFEDLRKHKDGQLRELAESKRAETNRLSSAFESTLREEKRTNQLNMDDNRLGMKEGISRNRDRFQKALDERDASSRNSTEAFKASTADRINNRLNAGDAENHHLKNEITRQQTSMNKAKNREVQNVRDSMQANIVDLEEQRLATVEASNEKNKGEIDKVQKQNNQLVNRTNRFFQDKIVNERITAEERNTSTKFGLEKRLERAEMTGDDRASKLQVSNQRGEANLKSFFENTSNAQRDNYESTLRDLRETNKRDQDTIFQNFAKQSNEREMKFQQKISSVSGKFETEIQVMKEDQTKKMTDQMTIANKEKKNIVEQKNGEILRQASQYENRIAKLEETHRREVDGIKERHAESLTSMTRSKGRP